jgi:hypothetical protein
LQEAIVALRADGDARLQVERSNHGLGAAHSGLGPLADQQAGIEVVGGEQGVDGVLRLGGSIQSDDEDALGARLLDAGHNGLGIAWGNQDALGACVDHVLECGDLTFVIAVLCAGAGQQLRAQLIGLRLRAFLHLDEEGVGLGLGDEADDDLT